MTENHHLTVDDAARRDRLDAAMTTRAARWCGEIVALCLHQDAEAGRESTPPGTIARDYAGMLAKMLVAAIYEYGDDPAELGAVEDAWQVRALEAWSHLEYLDRWPGTPVPEVYEKGIRDLVAADAAVTWQLPSERIAR